jgi:immune inhibitor A
MRGGRLTLVAVLAAGALSIVAGASAGPDDGASKEKAKVKDHGHILWHPQLKQQFALRKQAIRDKLAGKAKGKVHQVAKGQFVELELERTDRVFVILAEFGNTRHPSFPDLNPDTRPTPALAGFDGPLHNKIPPPDRAIDNSTLWQADYSPAHYRNMYFERMAEYYEDQSSGRYTIDGDVTEWVKVPFNEARYGRNSCGSNICTNVFFLMRDAMAQWVADQKASGKTIEEIAAYLRTFDKWDRNDVDGDGNFDESDGFIDHFQIVHAGGDEAAGDPWQGEDAIWSHRSIAALAFGPGGQVGFNAGSGGASGGLQIPNNPTGVWVGDYTIQGENGGLGVFAHEYGHDLNLPDLYDTSGNAGGGENTTGFWDLMSSGANIGDGGPDGIGDAPTNMSAWDKFQLGWLTYDEAQYGVKSEHKLNAIGATTKKAQAVVMKLPKEQNVTVTQYGVPTSGTKAYWSQTGNNIDHTMTSPDITLPAGGPLTLSLNAWYKIETCWDYAYVRVVDGSTTTNLVTSISDPANENDQNFGGGITGVSGHPKVCDGLSGDPAWVPATADLTPWAGKTIKLQLRYWTDPFVVGPGGFEVDDLEIKSGATSVWKDDAEGSVTWTQNGFITFPGNITRTDDHYYIAEYRTFRDRDTSLATAYNFGFLAGVNARPDWVETHRYEPGLLVWYWDLGYSDNSTSLHPGQGEALPVDAHPTLDHWADGQLMRGRIQARDSTFGLWPTSPLTLHKDGVPTSIGSRPGVPVFNDLNTYWFAGDGHSAASHGRHQVQWQSVNVPKTGTTIRVKNTSAHGEFMQVEVAPAR